MSLCLALDTSLLGIRAALISSNKSEVKWSYSSSDAKSTASSLLGELKNKLTSDQLNIDDIESIMISTGPGSFTGIKIGLAFAYGLCETPLSRRPIYGFSMFELIARHYLKDFSLIILPSTQNSAFLAYDENGDVKVKNYYFSDKQLGLSSSMLSKPLVIADSEVKINDVIKIHSFIGYDQVNQLCINLFSSVFKTAWPESFSADLPQPVYLRKSSPEEKLSHG